MRKGFLRAVAVLLAGSGLALAQPPYSPLPDPGKEPPRLAVDKLPVPDAGAISQKSDQTEKIAAPKDAGKPPPAKPSEWVPRDCPAPCNPCLPTCCDVCGPPG